MRPSPLRTAARISRSRPCGARWVVGALVLGAAALLGGCATSGRGGGPSPDRDGPDANPPPGLAQVPDAEPKLEPIRAGGPNKPYTVWGETYVPLTVDTPLRERGLASWYGRKFSGKPTASGELYDMYAMTAAHPTLPIPSYARIRNPANGREVVVRINDRGPFHGQRIVDVSYTAALKLDILRGATPVELERITFDEIRTGAWRRDTAGATRVAQPAPIVVTPPPVTPLPPAPDAGAAATSMPLPAGEALGQGVAAPVDSPPVVPAGTALPTIDDTASGRAATLPARGFWVQLGAFRQHDGVVALRRRVEANVDWITPLLSVVSDATLFRLQAGPYPRRDDARDVAERLRSVLQVVPVIVERR